MIQFYQNHRGSTGLFQSCRFPNYNFPSEESKTVSSNENIGTKMVIFKATLFEIDCCEHWSERQNTTSVILKILEGKYMQCTIPPCYSMSPGLWRSTLFFCLSGSGDVMFERESFSHGSFVLVSRQMLPNSRTRTCSISKFPPYNLKKKKK